MKDVRAIAMDQNPATIELVVGIAANVLSLVDQKYIVARGREAFRYYASCEARTDH
jgi:hypothetical protein